MQKKQHKVVLVIDGEEIPLDPNGESKSYLKFKHEDEQKRLIVSVYLAPDWSGSTPLASLASLKS